MWSWPARAFVALACLTQVKALEAAGVIERYVALVNAKTWGWG